jgi:hypothetical protein
MAIGNTPVLVRADERVELVDTQGRRTTVRLGDVLADCPPHPAAGEQLCKRPDVQDVVVGHVRDLDSTLTDSLLGILVLGALGGGVVCAIDCSSPANYVAGGAILGTLALAITGAIVLTGYNGGHAN